MENNTPSSPAGGAAPKRYSEVPLEEKLADVVAWLEEHKAARVVSIEMAGQGGFADALIVASAGSVRHAQSLADGVGELCRNRNFEFLRMEGYAAGQLGYKFFGIVLWAAAITSVVGAAYTSVSFLRSMSKVADKYNSYTIMAFIAISTLVFVLVGRPVKVLVLVGSLNGLILPITLGVMLLAARNRKIVGDYQHPMWLQLFGILAAAAAAWAGWLSLQGIANLWK